MISKELDLEELAQKTNPKRKVEIQKNGPTHYHYIVVDVKATFTRENYGADADGNRGEMRTYQDNTGGNYGTLVTYGRKKNANGQGRRLERIIDLTKITDSDITNAIESAVEDYEPLPDDYPPDKNDIEPDLDDF